jgi:hypothetical protein
MKTDTTAEIGVVNAGEYPMSYVDIDVIDKDKPTANTWEEIKAQRRRISLPNLAPKRVYTIAGDLTFSNNENVSYIMHIYDKNGSFTQFLKMKKVDGKWREATKLEKNFIHKGGPFPPSEKIYDYIDPSYPKDAKGEVEWQ